MDSTGTTVFVYNAAGQLIAEYVENGGGGSMQMSYLTVDHLGSTRVVTDSSGVVKARHDYLPFGEEIGSDKGGRASVAGYASVDSTRQRFTGQQRDTESGMDYFVARYYSSAQGRFTSPDDFLNDTHVDDPTSWNFYVYVRNNPLRFIDTTGTELRLIRTTDSNGNTTENISGANRQALLDWLNHVYGCKDCVTIDKDNYIRVDTSQVSKDVLAATKDLTDAITDKNHLAFVVGYEGNENVNFARAVGCN